MILVGVMVTWFSEKIMISIDEYMVSCPTCTKNIELYLLVILFTFDTVDFFLASLGRNQVYGGF